MPSEDWIQHFMTHVLGEVAWVRKAYPPGLLAKPSGTSVGALTVRNSITKGGFAELRRHGYPLTGEFLNLEGEIDNFARQYEDRLTNASVIIREGNRRVWASNSPRSRTRRSSCERRPWRRRTGLWTSCPADGGFDAIGAGE